MRGGCEGGLVEISSAKFLLILSCLSLSPLSSSPARLETFIPFGSPDLMKQDSLRVIRVSGSLVRAGVFLKSQPSSPLPSPVGTLRRRRLLRLLLRRTTEVTSSFLLSISSAGVGRKVQDVPKGVKRRRVVFPVGVE